MLIDVIPEIGKKEPTIRSILNALVEIVNDHRKRITAKIASNLIETESVYTLNISANGMFLSRTP